MTEGTNEIIFNNDKTNGQAYFREYHKNVKKSWFYKQNITRKLIVSVNRIKANHYNPAASLRIELILLMTRNVNAMITMEKSTKLYDNAQERGELLQNLF